MKEKGGKRKSGGCGHKVVGVATRGRVVGVATRRRVVGSVGEEKENG